MTPSPNADQPKRASHPGPPRNPRQTHPKLTQSTGAACFLVTDGSATPITPRLRLVPATISMITAELEAADRPSRQLLEAGAVRQRPAQLLSRGDPELAEDLPQVVRHGVRADEQLRGDLGV